MKAEMGRLLPCVVLVLCFVFPSDFTSGSPNTTFRLVGGPVANVGRLEIHHDGLWGTVCSTLRMRWDYSENKKNAHVICRMMGYEQAVGYYNKTEDVPPRFTVEIDCTGSENSTQQCGYLRVYPNRYCGFRNRILWLACKSRSDSKFAVRLVDGQTLNQGRVEVRIGGVWGTVCRSSQWNILDANVVCRMLGYHNASRAGLAKVKGEGFILRDHSGCRGNELSLKYCSSGQYDLKYCDHSTDVGVSCRSLKGDIPSLQVRFERVATPNSGRVAVRYGNTWGTVCNKGLDINDTKAICRMLGYDGVSHVRPTSSPGNGTVWLSNIGCNGTESTIADCRPVGWWQTTCEHDAVVTCVKKGNPPHFQINGSHSITDSTVVILFNDKETQSQQLQRRYQVLVEKRKDEHVIKSYFKTLPDSFGQFNITMAAANAQDVYITAEIPPPTKGHHFTIGDGLYYYGYYNAPLGPGCTYRVYVRVVTMAIDGKRIHGYAAFVVFTTKTTIQGGSSDNISSGRKLNSPAIGLSVVMVIMVLTFIGYIVFNIRQRKTRKQPSPQIEMKDVAAPKAITSVVEPPESQYQELILPSGQTDSPISGAEAGHYQSLTFNTLGQQDRDYYNLPEPDYINA